MKYPIALFIFVSVLLFATCENPNKPTTSVETVENVDSIYLQKGQKIAAATFMTLSRNLQKAMQAGGVSNAIKYCNVAAMPLVDSLSKVHDAEIRRTSLRVRNPEDRPTPQELKQLQVYESQSNKGEKLQPVVQEIGADKIAFYAPIHVMPLCEKCHGKVGSTLLEKDYQLIQQFYPEDQAIGYVSGDLRGMWSITFKK